MNDFVYNNPTKVHFGKNAFDSIGAELNLHGVKKVLLVYGGGSIRQNGIYDRIIAILDEYYIEYVEHCGVKGNPMLSHAYAGEKLANENEVDAILAIGGGSVIDEAKAIAAGAISLYDIWDFYDKTAVVTKAMPVFAVSTLPATASEMNGVSVLTNDETLEKCAVVAPGVLNPKVCFMDPTTTFSLSLEQTAFACADIISHLTEAYLTTGADSIPVQGRMIEGLVKSVMDAMGRILENPGDYDARAEFMWTATLGWNGIAQTGIPAWGMPCHAIEMPMSAVYDVAHGAGLAVITPAWMNHAAELHKDRILRFGKCILGIDTGNVFDVAEALKEYYKSIGAPTSFADLGIEDPDLDKLTELAHISFVRRNINGYTADQIKVIFKNSL